MTIKSMKQFCGEHSIAYGMALDFIRKASIGTKMGQGILVSDEDQKRILSEYPSYRLERLKRASEAKKLNGELGKDARMRFLVHDEVLKAMVTIFQGLFLGLEDTLSEANDEPLDRVTKVNQ